MGLRGILSRRRGCRTAAAAVAASLLGVAAGAQGVQPFADDREFQSVWLVQPSDAPLGPRTLEDSDFVYKQRLVPPTLVRVKADAVDPQSKKVIVPSGSQLFGVLTSGPPIYCLAGVRDASVMKSLLIGGGNRQVCLVDSDRDGALDGHFGVGNAIKGLPNISGKRPKKLKPLAPAAFETLAPEAIAIPYFVGVKYEGIVGLALKNKTPVFSVVFGTDESSEMLTGQIRPVEDSDPMLVKVLGAEFAVTERRDRTLSVDVRSAIPPQPFGVVQTVTYRTY